MTIRFASIRRAFAVLMALICADAFGNGTFVVTLADYNSAQVAANNYVVVVPEYSTVNSTLYDTHYTLASGTELETGSFLTLTLPSGFTFASAPQLYYAGAEWNPNSNVVGSNSATFQVPATVLASSGNAIYVYPAFSINTPQSFGEQFGSGTYSMSMQATGNVVASNNDPAPVSQPAFAHAVGSLPDTITPGSGAINLANPYFGDQFVASGSTVADSGLVATFAINTELNDPFVSNATVLTPAGTINTLSASDTANITIDGPFNGIGLVYADTTIAACQGAVPSGSGVYSGTVTSSSISFIGIPINTPVQICMIPFGVMWAGNQPYVYTYSQGAGVTDYFGGLSQTTAGNFYTYQASATTVMELLGGSPQSTFIESWFCSPLAVKVYDTSTTPVYELKGIDVVYAAPTNNQSADFSSTGSVQANYQGALAGTDANGIAVVPVSANSVAGVYTVTAKVGNLQQLFGLTNEPGTSGERLYCNGFDF